MASDWQRALVALAATVVGAAVIGVLYWARAIFIPVTLAIFLAFVLGPIVARLQRRGLGRTTAVITTVGVLLLCTVGIGALIVQQVSQLADRLPDRQEAIKAKLLAAKQWAVGDGESRFGKLVDDVTSIVAPKPPPQNTVTVAPASPIAGMLDTYGSPIAEVLGQMAFTFILTVYMLLRREDLRNRVIRLLGAGKVTTTTRAVDDASRRISSYLFSQFLVNTAFGLVITVGLFILGVKYAILWGFIATVMRYVPYIGTWIGLIPPVVYSFATATPETWTGEWGQPFLVLALFLGLEAFCNNIIEPHFYGQSMGLSEVAQLVAAAFWGFLWGPIGLILSGPLTVCLLVLGRHVSRFNFFVVLLGDESVLEPRVAFYQRLAARDQDEATEVALAVAKKSNPVAVFDEVFIPALAMARRDYADGDLDKTELKAMLMSAREVAEEVVEEVAEPRDTPVGDPAERVRVFICPARDESEHVASDLLALTLDPNRWEVKVAGDETLASEVVGLVTTYKPAVVVIAVMPPGGLSHAKYLMTKLRRQNPAIKLLIGRWGGEEVENEPREEKIQHTDGVDRTLAGTRKRLGELHQQLLAVETKPVPEGENKKELVGTRGA